MNYSVEFTKNAKKQLAKLDKATAKLITSWIYKNLQNCTNPRQHGKGLTANRSGQWRYRVGDYRLLADIQENRIVILILEIGHRSTIYER
ncbi:MAG: type II toxin-antitoxin system RelE/ParE family toxin [Ruminococcus flavefaciens]|nr:type II toxin-antitoxin system RelE/ParE family toxin [Ruminococcus flavefaciens]